MLTFFAWYFFMLLLSSDDIKRNTIREPNGSNPFFGPGLGPNSLQRLLVADKDKA